MQPITSETICAAIRTSWATASRQNISPEQYRFEWKNVASELNGMWMLANWSDSRSRDLLDDINVLRLIAADRGMDLQG